MFRAYIGGVTAIWVVFLLSGVTAQAASLYIDPPTDTLYRGDAVTLSVRLDVDEAAGECINAVDATVTYPENIQPVDVSTANSIFNVWIEPPTINKENRTITFAGGIPNGYCGRVVGDPRLTNVLTQLIFRSPGFMIGGSGSDPTATIAFADSSTAYLNDGRGTKANLTTFGSNLTLDASPSSQLRNDWQDQVNADNVPPTPFSIELQRDERAFSREYYIVFNTTDKQTGIDTYQVMEEPVEQLGSFQWGRATAPWITARSPYVLDDQSLNSTIRVKAIDKAGNEYVATLIPDESLRSIQMSSLILIGFSIVILLLLGLIFFVLVKQLRNRYARRKSHSEPVAEEVNEDIEHDSHD